ncbi:MAG: ABC transporter permease subunit [Anaerolineae bacterium]|nr:ABC transporter permease subunit [Anaerolineae bacterium]
MKFKWAWVWIILGIVYFFLPLVATINFSLKAERGRYSFRAYQIVLQDPQFISSFTLSIQIALLTIVFSLLLIVPTVYWAHLRLPQVRPILEFIAFLPFVLPAVVLVFGLIRIYSGPPFALFNRAWGTNLIMVGAYMALALPYMYRSVDTGLRAIDVRTLTEAAQSLGASWPVILWRVIFPNLRTALLSGAFLTFAIVIGEYTIAAFLGRFTFGPYLALLVRNRAYEPAALSILSFAITWSIMGLIQWLTYRAPGSTQVAAGPR